MRLRFSNRRVPTSSSSLLSGRSGAMNDSIRLPPPRLDPGAGRLPSVGFPLSAPKAAEPATGFGWRAPRVAPKAAPNASSCMAGRARGADGGWADVGAVVGPDDAEGGAGPALVSALLSDASEP